MTSSAGPAEEAYDDILRAARRFTRSADEARDLAQDALLIALARGLEDWASPAHRAWLRGVVRRRAAFLVRGHTRRRRRERLLVGGGQRKPGRWRWEPGFLATLPRSLRAVATLASADLCTAEVQWLLGLSNTAIRKRLSALRRAVRAEAEPPTLPAPPPQLMFGPQRALLLSVLRRQRGRAPATHDPDGHVILLRVNAHKAPPVGNT